jgi:hypothetical protein
MTTTAQDKNKPLFTALKSPFFSKDLEWRIGNTNKDKTRGRALPYLKFKAVADRLDDVLGEENWKDEYVAGPAGGVVCRLSVRVAGEWICKENGAGNTDTEGIKGGLTDAFKRAATMWGVGRYLHAYDAIVVDVDPNTNRFQPPALPDALLPAEEVEENRLAYEAAAQLMAEAEKLAAATAAASGGTATTSIAKPVKVSKPAKAATVPDIPAADATGVQPAVEEGKVSGLAEQPAPVIADQVVAVAPAEVAEVARAAEVLDLHDAVKVADAVDVVVDAAQVKEVVKVAEVAEVVDFKEVAVVADAAVEPVAAPVVAEVVEAATTPEVAPALVADAAAPDGEVLIALDADGMPVMPEGLPEPQVKRIAQLVERINKDVPLYVIRDYVESGKGHDSMTPVSRAYVLARLNHKQKQLESAANAA